MLCYGSHPPFGQAGKWQHVSRTVTELGEEPHVSFGSLSADLLAHIPPLHGVPRKFRS